MGFLPALSFATILLTNLILVFGSLRVRRAAPAEPAGLAEPAEEV
jgi:hypothetical protein